MKNGHVICMVLACAWGWGLNSAAREIPVHREYTQPVLFYDERGERMAFGDAAPDVVALQSMRDTKAREILMGRETLMEMSFGVGKSVFDEPAPLKAAGVAASGGGDGSRGKTNPSERNWLVKSLKLPNLGQESGDPAKTAMSSGAGDSSWGWLADEVASQDAAEDPGAEDILPGDDLLPLTPQEMALAGTDPVKESLRSNSKPKEESKGERESSSLSDRAGVEQKTSDMDMERSANMGRDVPAGFGDSSSPMKSYRTAGLVAEMSQTRKMIDEMSAGSRGGMTSLQDSIRNLRATDFMANSEQKTESAVAAPVFSSRAMEDGDRKAFGGRPPVVVGWSGAGTAVSASSWQGGWNSQNSEKGGWSRMGSLPDPAPAVVTPASSRATPLPGISSGGYKPGWF